MAVAGPLKAASILSEREAKLCSYLERVAGQEIVSRRIADSAWKAWEKLAAAVANLPVPDAGPGPDGSLLFAWDKDENHLELEFQSDEQPSFFYANRQTGEAWEESFGWVRNMALECREGGRMAWLCR